MNFLIIGGTRFIGLETARQLYEAGHQITLFHRTLLSGLPYKQFQGNRDDIDALRTCIAQIKPDCIIHMVAMEAQHIAVLEKALCGQKMRVIVVSSGDVYKAFEVLHKLSGAPVQPVPLAETSPLREVRYPFRNVRSPFDNYEKIDVEAAAMNSEAVDAIIVRLGMIFGKHDPNKRFADTIQTMRQSNRMEVPANVASWRTCYSGVKNTAHGIILACEKAEAGEVFNIADEGVFTEIEWYDKIARLIHWKGRIIAASSVSTAFNFDQQLILDTSKIRRELGFVEICHAEEQLKEII